MGYIEIFFIAVSLAMDAFAVSVSNGLMLPKIQIKHAIIFGLFFGVFQFIMPLIGWACGSRFSQYIVNVDHWVAFVLLSLIGGKMVYETFKDDENNVRDEKNIMSFSNLTILAIATSIDALAVGVTFALVKVNVLSASVIIGIVAFILSFVGVMLGKKIGSVFQTYAERIGGLVLIGIGIKILIEHLFFV